jgi:hypothetical protein
MDVKEICEKIKNNNKSKLDLSNKNINLTILKKIERDLLNKKEITVKKKLI